MEKVRITFIRDPHRFWFCREDFDLDDEITVFRAKLRQAIRTAAFNNEAWQPAVGENVAFFQKNGIWDRATVEDISPNGDIRVWLEDLGFPQTVKKRDIRPMPHGIKLPVNKIVREGGLFEVIPAKRKFNVSTLRVEMIDCGGVWSPDAIDLMKEVVDIAETTIFEVKCSPDKTISYGNLIFVMPNGSRISAKEILMDYCMHSEAFLQVISKNLCQSLRRLRSDIPGEVQLQNTQQFVNEWVEKVWDLDLQQDNFDESVSTYHVGNQNPRPPPIRQQSPPTQMMRKVALAGVAPASDEWDTPVVTTTQTRPPKQKPKENDEFDLMPSGIARGFGRGRGISSDCSNTYFSLAIESEKEARSVSDAHDNVALEMYLKSQGKSQEKTQEKLPEKSPDVSQSSRSARVMPDPAGMLYGKEMSKKDKRHYVQVSRVDNKKKSFEKSDEVRHLGDAAVALTAKKRYQRVLVHCPFPVKMIESINEATLRPEVHEKLRRDRIIDVHRVQSHALPLIFRGGSIIIIGQKKSGKTMAYLPMLYTRMMNAKKNDEGDLSVGARAIVICASSKKVVETSNRFLSYHDPRKGKPEVLASCSPRDTQRHVIELQNGCDILFTTAPAFKRLLQGAKDETCTALTPADIRYVVIDDYDGIVGDFRNELNLVFKTCLSQVDEHGLHRAQVVITSCKWMPEFREYWRKFDNPMLCIASGIESALYGGAKFSMHIMNKVEKVNAIMEILATEEYFNEPTMIVCNTPEEVDHLTEFLMKASVSVMAFTVPTLERHQIKKNAVIVCTDACLMDINVRNIQHLMHFSLPEKWSMFDGRFVVCFDYYEDQVSSERVNKAPVMVNIFLDEDNDFQLPKVVHFMKTRFGNVTIPPEILQCANASLIRREDEKIRKKIPLCSDMLEFGECKIRQFDCTYRHVFNASDAPSEWLPKWGYVRMRILSVVSPLHFKVHILHTMKSHIDPFDKWTAVNESDKYFAFQNNLNGHMMQAENQMTPASRDVQMGQIYLFKFEHNYLRVRIESCVMERAVLLATITSIDVAKIVKKTCPSNDLLTLPEQFCNFPQQLIDIRLFGLEPNDHEMVWDGKSIDRVKSWIKSTENLDQLAFIGHIELTMRETIYVKSLQCVEFFDSNQTNFVKWSVKGEILKNKLAVESPADRMFFISDLVKQYGIHTAKSEEMMMSKNQEKPREAHVKWMRVPTEALMDANILDFTALDEFYVQDLSAVARLKELQRKIREFTASELKVKETIKVGDNCLVPLDTMFCRGKVWKETDQVDEFHVFHVDEGHIAVYNASQIYEISTKLTEEYPFFAIRCSLLGVTEPIPQLTNDDLDEIYEKFIQGPTYRLSLQIYPVEEVIVSTGGKCQVPMYSVIMLAHEESDIVVNRRLITEKFVVEDPEKWPLVKKFMQEELPDMLPEDPAVAIPENGLRDYLEFEKPLPELPPQQDNSSIASTTSNTDQRVLFEIKPLSKAPLVEWHQNFEEIFLKITAVEMKDYHLVVQQRFLSLTLIFPDRPQQGFVLNFFGCISPKSTQIKVKPNYLIVRLKKTIGGREFMWADLVDPPEKLHWLKRIIYEATSDLSDSDLSDCPAEFSKFDTYKKYNSDRNSDSYDEDGSDSDDGLLI